ncbi:MAG: glycosyltransferase [Sphingobacteriaceae bacterium]|nr:glycosyltransferase [Sphingobacteriaceae bacterium]
MDNVALILLGVEKLEGGGGAERFFADFFLLYQKHNEKKYNLFFVIDSTTYNSLKTLGRDLPTENILILKTNSTRFKKQIENFRLAFLLRKNKIRILQFCLYTPYYYRFIQLLDKYKLWIGTKTVINIVNCEIPHAYFDKTNPYHQGYINTYGPLFNDQTIDGYFCWNKLFIDFTSSNKLIKKNRPLMSAIESRFSNLELYYPEKKENLIVFAGRLDFRKRPDWFIEAVSVLFKKTPDIFKDYKFLMFGTGPMLDELNALIKERGIASVLKIETNPKLWTVLRKSKVFVSCQDYDNFPSLAITEAMAAGNAIVARNVGQTDYFVKHEQNGFLVEPDSPVGLADALLKAIKSDEKLVQMGRNSETLISTVHTFENFVRQIEDYWSKLINSKNLELI